MQKIINCLAVTSFVVSASAVGAGAYAWMNKEALAEKAQALITERVKGAVTDAIGGTILGGGSGDGPSLPIPSLPF